MKKFNIEILFIFANNKCWRSNSVYWKKYWTIFYIRLNARHADPEVQHGWHSFTAGGISSVESLATFKVQRGTLSRLHRSQMSRMGDVTRSWGKSRGARSTQEERNSFSKTKMRLARGSCFDDSYNLYCIVLYCIVLYCIVLYCIVNSIHVLFSSFKKRLGLIFY